MGPECQYAADGRGDYEGAKQDGADSGYGK